MSKPTKTLLSRQAVGCSPYRLLDLMQHVQTFTNLHLDNGHLRKAEGIGFCSWSFKSHFCQNCFLLRNLSGIGLFSIFGVFERTLVVLVGHRRYFNWHKKQGFASIFVVNLSRSERLADQHNIHQELMGLCGKIKRGIMQKGAQI